MAEGLDSLVTTYEERQTEHEEKSGYKGMHAERAAAFGDVIADLKALRRLASRQPDQRLVEFDAWLSFRPEFREVLDAFRQAFGTDTSAASHRPEPQQEGRGELWSDARLGELTDAAMNQAAVVAALDKFRFDDCCYSRVMANRMREALNAAIAVAWDQAARHPHREESP